MNFGPVLTPDGSAARLDAPLAWALLAGAALLFVMVMALLVHALTRPPEPSASSEPTQPPKPPLRAQPLRARRWLLGGGLVLPLVVLGALAVVNLLHLLGPGLHAPAHSTVVGVNAKAWWWQLRVPDPGHPDLFSANELVLPVGRPVRLAMVSEDLIHSLWVPALAGKVDLLPGRVQHLVLHTDKAGRWSGPCAEFCGLGHTKMVLQVVALPAADYDAWLHNQRLPARTPTSALQQRGLQHFIELRCGACHTVRGVVQAVLGPGGPAGPGAAGDGAQGSAGGPDLTHLASREFLGAGTVRNNAAGLRAWITGVQTLKPGARMPGYDHLDNNTLDALVAYLLQLQ